MKKKAMYVGVMAALLAVGYAGAAWGGEDDGDNDREFVRAGPAHGNMGNRGNSANKPNKPDHPAHPEHPATPGHGNAHRLNPNNLSLCDDPALELVGPEGQAGKSQVAHTNFLPAVQSTGEPAEADDWARMTYFWLGSTFDFIFNAHQLEPATTWTLVAVAGDGTAICLGNGTVNGGGQLHILGSVDPEASFPTDLDPFAPRTDETEDATLQLIPTATVDCTTGAITAGEGNMLVSSFGVRFVDVDVLTCPAPPPPP